MRRTVVIATGLVCVAAASYAASEALMPQEPEVIEIEVTAAELADCRETLSQVASMPAVHDNGSPILFDFSEEMPQVKCVVAETA